MDCEPPANGPHYNYQAEPAEVVFGVIRRLSPDNALTTSARQ
jgi:hypothetical protein